MSILFILGFYIVLVWGVVRLVVPHLGFVREPIPEHIPVELEKKIYELTTASASDFEYLQKSYDYITDRYSGSRVKTITRFWRAFGDMFEKSPGFLPCTGQNFLLRTMLVKSGRFQEVDIKIKTVPLNFFIHQYLKVKVDDRWIDVDPWSRFKGVSLGGKSFLFG